MAKPELFVLVQDDATMECSRMSPEQANPQIDAVVTWVDGGDLEHRAKRSDALRSESAFSVNGIPGGRDETRFACSGEIFYCLELLRKHCPWLRTIYLLTDNQRPAFITADYCESRRVVVVDHREVFKGYEWALPTFNSQSIETVMHRIEGLSENFIYLNDDFFVLKHTPQNEFFADGRIVLRGDWGRVERFGVFRRVMSAIANHVSDKIFGVVRPMAVLAQYRAAQMAGFTRQFLHAPHTPYPIRKSTLTRYYDDHPGVLESNVKYKFRNMMQFVPMPLANHLEISKKTAIVSDEKDYLIICINRQSRSQIERNIRCLEKGQSRFLCVQGFELATKNWRCRIEHVLRASLGERE